MDFPSLAFGLTLGAIIGAALWALLRAQPRLNALTLRLAQLDALRAAEVTAGSTAQQALQAAAAQAFATGQQQLLQLTEAKLKETQAGTKTDLTALLTPIQTNLEQLAQHNRALEQSRTAAHADLNQQITSLRDETGKLSRALRAPHTRGRWGEVQLQRLLELSGMAPYAEYDLQASYDVANAEAGGTRLRPDCVISLPGGKKVIVDVKTPLDAYLDVEAATDAIAQKEAMVRHARQLKKHVAQLSDKRYRDLEPGAENVILFVPGEHFLSAALQEDQTIFEDALTRGVIIASTTTLMVLLKAYAYGWGQQNVVANANKVIDTGRELHDRLKTMAGYLQKAGAGISSAMKNFNAAVGSYESRVLPQARKFVAMGVIADGQMSEVELDTIEEVAPRALSNLGAGSADVEPLKLTGTD